MRCATFLCRRLVIRIESEMQLGTLTLEDHETDWVSVGERHAHSEQQCDADKINPSMLVVILAQH